MSGGDHSGLDTQQSSESADYRIWSPWWTRDSRGEAMRTVEILIPETFEHLTPDQRAMLVRRIDAWHDRYERTERTEKALQELQFRASRKIDNLNDSNNQGG